MYKMQNSIGITKSLEDIYQAAADPPDSTFKVIAPPTPLVVPELNSFGLGFDKELAQTAITAPMCRFTASRSWKQMAPPHVITRASVSVLSVLVPEACPLPHRNNAASCCDS